MLNNIRLGDINTNEAHPAFDMALEDEINTNRAMAMMRNLNDSNDDVDLSTDLENFLKHAEQKSIQKKTLQSNDYYPNEEEENEIFYKLLSTCKQKDYKNLLKICKFKLKFKNEITYSSANYLNLEIFIFCLN